MRVAIVDCGISNLASIRRAVEDLGAIAVIAREPTALYESDRIVLPGVGAYPAAMTKLRTGGWVDALHHHCRDGARPLLGICLGMQLLADSGEEVELTQGLGLVPGRVRRLGSLGCVERIPHVGWNGVRYEDAADPLFAHIPQDSDFYFVHSFAFDPPDAGVVTSRTDYSVPVVASIRNGNVFGTQFHPEKSSKVGRQLLQNFLDFRPC